MESNLHSLVTENNSVHFSNTCNNLIIPETRTLLLLETSNTDLCIIGTTDRLVLMFLEDAHKRSVGGGVVSQGSAAVCV